MKKGLLILFVVYAAWSCVALVEVVSRKVQGQSILPGFMANHNGNIALSGFIMAAAFPGAFLAGLADKRGSRGLVVLSRMCVPVAGAAWGAYFILMEFLPLYSRNVPDLGDLTGSAFGLICGIVFGVVFQDHVIKQWCLTNASTRTR